MTPASGWRRRAPGLVLAIVACAAEPAGPRAVPVTPAVMPGPAPLHRAEDAAARNGECVGCHDDIAAEWQDSLHRAAYTSRDFQSALRSEPLPFCRGCHAPEADPRRPEPELAALGVGCVSCHLPVGDAVLSARAVDAPNEAAHPVLRAAAFATADACANCHQFTFPDRRPVPEYMQTTVHEHRASTQRDRSCADCHMPRVTGADGQVHRSHAFTGSRDPDGMREAFTVRASRPAADRVLLTLDLREENIGHAFPTGDLLRRLTLAVAVERGATAPQRRFLARHWTRERPGLRSLEHDDRLGVGEDPRVVEFRLDPADAGRVVSWRVRFERVQAFVGPGEDGARVVGGLDLFAGTLPAFPP